MKLYLAFVISSLTSCVASMEAQMMDYILYCAKYGKSYNSMQEFEYRYELYAEAQTQIDAINTKEGQTHTVGHNQFSDMSSEEYKKLLNFVPHTVDTQKMRVQKFESIQPEIDWRNKGAVTNVSNQGECGACYAFAAAGTVESALAIAGFELRELSKQQMIECADYSIYQLMGCYGGLYTSAWRYIIDYGLETEEQYPYIASNGHQNQCQYQIRGRKADIQSYSHVEASLYGLKEALNEMPVAVAVQADSAEFQYYQTGVITGQSCGTNVDHSVIAVGYGEDYFIIKNSWSALWGELGYAKIGFAEGAGICGINQYGAHPNVY